MSRPDLTLLNRRIADFRGRVQKVLPAVYDDSLSYYELLGKVMEHLNQNGQLTNDMVELWNEVNNWIVNDGVKEGVSVKLDEYLVNGQLENVINVSLFNGLSTRLDSVEKKATGYYKLSNYPRLTGETNDTPRIKRMLNEAIRGSKVIFTGGELEITEPIVLNRSDMTYTTDGFTTVKAITTMDSCIHIKSENTGTIVANVFFEKLNINANKMAQVGLLVHDTVGQYASTLNLTKFQVRDSITDGIRIVGPTWIVKVDDIISQYNGRDGVRVVMHNSGQVNAIRIENSFIQSNGNNGITIQGASHVVRNNTLERNRYGVSIDPTINNVSGQTGTAISITVDSNYAELNTLAQLHVASNVGSNAVGINLINNYLLSSGDTLLVEGYMIKFTGNATNSAKIRTSGNYYYKQGNVKTDIDGGGLLNQFSTIEDTSLVINGGYASIKKDGFKIATIDGSMIRGATYDNLQKSENMVSNTNKTLIFPLPSSSENKMINALRCFVNTDGTNTVIRMHYRIKNLETGVIDKSGYVDSTINGDGLASASVMSAWGTQRLTSKQHMYFMLELISTNATSVQFNIPYVEYTR